MANAALTLIQLSIGNWAVDTRVLVVNLTGKKLRDADALLLAVLLAQPETRWKLLEYVLITFKFRNFKRSFTVSAQTTSD